MSSSNNTQNTQQQQKPGLVAGHAEYIKGAAEVISPSHPPPTFEHGFLFNVLTYRLPQSLIGGVIGSSAWTHSGEQDKAHAKATLQAATENRDPQVAGYGKAEEVAGKLTGCDGMKKEGAASAHKHNQ